MQTMHEIPINYFSDDEDFTFSNYRKLLQLAKLGWEFFDYRNIEWEKKFIIWRHDVDLSLNCSLSLAKIEYDEHIKATYFINPHSEFYNIAEPSHNKIVKEILSLGHDIGLHFDSTYHGVKSESELNVPLLKESNYLKDLFGVKPISFSFHNPVAENLEFDADEYVGLINCYSKRFKNEIGYCSDSNGHWRFRRLFNVLSDQVDDRLQVLTHPGWWHKEVLPQRQKVFRAAFGRATETMKSYDRGLVDHKRKNNMGSSVALQIICNRRPHDFSLCDFLWNNNNFKTLFLKLWRIHEDQINNICNLFLRIIQPVSPIEIKQLIESGKNVTDGDLFFKALFQDEWKNALDTSGLDYDLWKKNKSLLIIEKCPLSTGEFEKGCVYLCSIITRISEWGLSQKFRYDGIVVQPLNNSPTNKLEPETVLVELIKKFIDDWSSFHKRLESIMYLNSSDERL